LVAMLTAGGAVAMGAIVIICLIGLLITSIFGIFFSSDSSNQIKMSDCIVELNEKMDGKIADIERREIHDEVIIESNQAPWKDILAVYATRVSNGNTEEVMTITPEKKKILEEVFWDMNSLSSEVKTENVTEQGINTDEILKAQTDAQAKNINNGLEGLFKNLAESLNNIDGLEFDAMAFPDMGNMNFNNQNQDDEDYEDDPYGQFGKQD